jgi:hypothetical protein
MRTFLLKLSDREEGPYSDSQVAQMFADARVNRYTPCRRVEDKDWKTVDDYLPTLKYGTQLPPPTPTRISSSAVAVTGADQRIAIADIDIPFSSILKMMFKWMAAGFVVFCCFVPAFIMLWVIVMAVFASLISGAMSSLHHP